MQAATLNTVGVDQPPCTALIAALVPPALGALDVPPLSREVVEFILRCFAKSKRTKWVYEQTDLQFPFDGITMAQVRAVATVHGIEPERGPSKGTKPTPGAGRKPGTRNTKGRISKSEEVAVLRRDNPDKSLEWIGQQFSPTISRQAVSKHLKKLGLT